MADANRVRVGVVAADPLRAMGLEAILQNNPAVDPLVCDLASVIRDHTLAALLLDDRFEGEDVIATVARLRRERPELKLIVLGEASDFQYIQALVGAGAHGYLLETTTEAEIRKAVDAVLDGSVWAPGKALARLSGAAGASNGAAATDEGGVLWMMTARERQILELLIDGKSNREIGRALGINEVTVKAHLGRMLHKTRSKNRVELTLRFIEERKAVKKHTAGTPNVGTNTPEPGG